MALMETLSLNADNLQTSSDEENNDTRGRSRELADQRCPSIFTGSRVHGGASVLPVIASPQQDHSLGDLDSKHLVSEAQITTEQGARIGFILPVQGIEETLIPEKVQAKRSRCENDSIEEGNCPRTPASALNQIHQPHQKGERLTDKSIKRTRLRPVDREPSQGKAGYVEDIPCDDSKKRQRGKHDTEVQSGTRTTVSRSLAFGASSQNEPTSMSGGMHPSGSLAEDAYSPARLRLFLDSGMDVGCFSIDVGGHNNSSAPHEACVAGFNTQTRDCQRRCVVDGVVLQSQETTRHPPVSHHLEHACQVTVEDLRSRVEIVVANNEGDMNVGRGEQYEHEEKSEECKQYRHQGLVTDSCTSVGSKVYNIQVRSEREGTGRRIGQGGDGGGAATWQDDDDDHDYENEGNDDDDDHDEKEGNYDDEYVDDYGEKEGNDDDEQRDVGVESEVLGGAATSSDVYSLRAECCACMSECCDQRDTVTCVSRAYGMLTDEGLNSLLHVRFEAASARTITHLNMSYCHVTDSGVDALRQALARSGCRLSYLNLEYNDAVSNEALARLIHGIDTRALQHINIRSTPIPTSSYTHVTTHSDEHECTCAPRTCMCMLGSAISDTLLAPARAAMMRTLQLSGRTYANPTHVLARISACTALEVLHLGHVHDDSVRASHVCDALSVITSLRTLDISGSAICSPRERLAVHMLVPRSGVHLIALKLSHCSMRNEEITSLVPTVTRYCTHMQQLDLGFNEFGDAVAACLVNLLSERGRKMQELCVCGNGVSEAGLKVLVDAAKKYCGSGFRLHA